MFFQNPFNLKFTDLKNPVFENARKGPRALCPVTYYLLGLQFAVSFHMFHNRKIKHNQSSLVVNIETIFWKFNQIKQTNSVMTNSWMFAAYPPPIHQLCHAVPLRSSWSICWDRPAATWAWKPIDENLSSWHRGLVAIWISWISLTIVLYPKTSRLQNFVRTLYPFIRGWTNLPQNFNVSSPECPSSILLTFLTCCYRRLQLQGGGRTRKLWLCSS